MGVGFCLSLLPLYDVKEKKKKKKDLALKVFEHIFFFPYGPRLFDDR